MRKLFAIVLALICGCASAQVYQKVDKLDLRNTTSTANPSFSYNQDGVLRGKTYSGVDTSFWDAQTGAAEFTKVVNTGTVNVFEVGEGREYASVQSAISAATDPDVDKVILVYPGTYAGYIIMGVDRTHIRGVDRSACIITYGGTPTIDVQASTCSLEGLTVTNTQATTDGRCVFGGQVDFPISDFKMRNCTLRSINKDTLYFQPYISGLLDVSECDIIGEFDSCAPGNDLSRFRNCYFEATGEGNSPVWAAGGGTHYFDHCLFVSTGQAITVDNGTAAYITNSRCIGQDYFYSNGIGGSGSSDLYLGDVSGLPDLMFQDNNGGDVTVHELDSRRYGGWEFMRPYQLTDPTGYVDSVGKLRWSSQYWDEGDENFHTKEADIEFSTDTWTSTPAVHEASWKFKINGDTKLRIKDTGEIAGYPRLLYASTATATVSNNASETNFTFTGVGSKVVTSGSEAVGQTYRITAHGIRHANTSSNQDALFKIKLGSVTLAEFSGGTATTIADGFTDPFSISALYTVRATGVSGSIAGGGTFEVVDTSVPATYAISANTGGAAAVNFTGNPEWHLSVYFDAAHPNLDAAIYAFTVEQLN